MTRPRLSWIPVRLMDDLIVRRSLSLDDWLAKARDFGLEGVEVYHGFLALGQDQLVAGLERFDLVVSMLTCSPDFAHPDPEARLQALREMKEMARRAAQIGARQIRVTTGIRHPGLDEATTIPWIVENLTELAEFAQPLGVTLALENHYKDRYWSAPDFAQRGEVFLRVYERLRPTAVMINFDCSNQLMVREDPVALLEQVKDRVISIHASDRRAGSYQHSAIGEGEVDYDAIFRVLRGAGFAGWVSAEDGNPEGDAGFARSLRFLRAKLTEFWPAHAT